MRVAAFFKIHDRRADERLRVLLGYAIKVNEDAPAGLEAEPERDEDGPEGSRHVAEGGP